MKIVSELFEYSLIKLRLFLLPKHGKHCQYNYAAFNVYYSSKYSYYFHYNNQL
jgi:hypothetical protein